MKVELLENRQLLSAVVVNTIVDQTDAVGSTTVSLRDALAIASAATTPTTITFDPTVFATNQTIYVTDYLTLAASADVTITGPTAGVTISGLDESAAYFSPDLNDSSTSGNVSISNVTFTVGGAYPGENGGGVNHTGGDKLSLTNVTCSYCYATNASGGGIFNSGDLTITDSTVTGSQGENGGGIYNSGNLTVIDSTISGNGAFNGGGAGGGIDNNGGTLKVIDSTVSYNEDFTFYTSVGGGGVANVNGGTATIVDSTINANTNYYYRSGYNPLDSAGGGVLSTGTLTITNSTISGNTGTEGGGVYSTGTLNVYDSTISANTGSAGGGVYLTGTATLANSVISGNLNTATGTSPDAVGAVTSKGNNFIGESDGSSGFVASDIVGTEANPDDAQLGALSNNSGPTLTMLPATGSPLIDAGSNSLIPQGITTDQRGLARISNGTVDIGAVETQPLGSTSSIAITPPGTQSAVVNTSQSFSLGSFTEVGATGPYSVSVNWGDGSAPTVFSITAPGTITPQSHTYATTGADTVTETITDSTGLVTGSGMFQVSVGTGSVTATPPADQTAFEGVSQPFTLGNFSDVNATGPFTVKVTWGDSSTATTFTQAAAGTIAPKTHTYAAIGTDTVTVTVTDSTGLITGSGTFDVLVSAGTITVTPPAAQTTVVNADKTFALGSFAQANTAGPYTVTVDWGDGTTDTTFTQAAAGTITGQAHAYTAAGTDTVTVTVTDAAGAAIGDATFIVTVNVATVTVTAPAAQTAFISTSKAFDIGLFAETNASGPYTVTVNWGDGSTATTFTTTSVGGLPAQSHTFGAVGTDTVTVTVTDANGATGSNTFIVTVTTGTTPSAISLTGSDATINFGEQELLTATVSPTGAAGTVTFYDNGNAIGTANISAGVATLTTTTLPSGTDVLTSTYNGNGVYASNTSNAVTVTVIPPPNATVLSLVSSAATTTTTNSIVLTATVNAPVEGSTVPTGSVSFYDGTTLLGSAAISATGVATITTTTSLPIGTDGLTAVYSGDQYYTGSTAPVVEVVVATSPTVTRIEPSTASKTLDQEMVLTATVAPEIVTSTTLNITTATGSINFYQDGISIGVAPVGSNGVATVATNTALPLGLDAITAIYSGNGSFASSASSEINVAVTTDALVPVITKVDVPSSAIGSVPIKHAFISATITNELNNIETGYESGIFAAQVFASSTTTKLNPAAEFLVASLSKKIHLADHRAIKVTIPVTSVPAALPTGTYHLLMRTTDSLGNTEIIDTGETILVVAPVVNLSSTFVSVPANALTHGAVVEIATAGNANDQSIFSAKIGLSTDAAGKNIVASGVGIISTGKLLIRLGHTTKVHVSGWKALAAEVAAGEYYLTLTLTDAYGNTTTTVSSQAVDRPLV